VIQSSVEIKAWLRATPKVAEVRPPACVACGTASCPVGERLQVHGQGLVARQVRGPLTAAGVPELVTLSARKYECQVCGAVMTVVPRGLLPGRQYSGQAIALALWLFVLTALSGVAVRARISPWRSTGRSGRRGWAQLYRWHRDVLRLFRPARPGPEGPPDEVVRRVLFWLVALAPAGLIATSDAERVFAGAALLR
jgi:hypothetical protein